MSSGPGGRGEAALGGHAHGAGDRRPEGEADGRRGEGKGAGGLEGESANKVLDLIYQFLFVNRFFCLFVLIILK